jgi:hypothetical protein
MHVLLPLSLSKDEKGFLAFEQAHACSYLNHLSDVPFDGGLIKLLARLFELHSNVSTVPNLILTELCRSVLSC